LSRMSHNMHPVVGSAWRRPAAAPLLAAILLAWAAPVGAVIKVDFPVSKIYAASKAVVTGTIASLVPANRVAEVKTDETLKGTPPGERFRVQVVAPAALFAQVAEGQPVVVFVGEAEGKLVAVVHLADTWLLAQGVPGASPPAWRVVQPYDAARSFPGRTAALVRLVGELKAGKATLQDEMEPEAFRGVREVAKLPVSQPTFLTPVDLNGDGKLDLAIGTASGVRLFLAGANGYIDVTSQSGVEGAAASHCAVGDANGDGKPDLLLGNTLWLRVAQPPSAVGKFTRVNPQFDLPPEAEWLAVTLADATGDGRPDAVVLLKSGKLVVLANPGSADKPWAPSSKALWQDAEVPGAAAFSTQWGDTDDLCVLVVRERDTVRYGIGPKAGPPAGFQRLTGTPLAAYKGLGGKPIKPLAAVAFDFDGNGRTDYLVVTEGGGLTLANRGFGTFLTNDAIHPVFHAEGEKKLPFALASPTLVAPGCLQAGEAPRQNLLVLAADGRLFEMDNALKP